MVFAKVTHNMTDSTVSRRDMLAGIGGAGLGAALLGTTTAGASSGRYIVGTSSSGATSFAQQQADAVSRVLNFGDIGQAVAGRFSSQAIEALANNPNVRYIERDGMMYALDHTVDEGDGDPNEEQVLPWGVDRVDADVAHHAGETGAGGEIAIIDTGIDPDHETLNVVGGAAFATCSGGCAEDWDDDNGHGTHCAGSASALDNDIGVVGVSLDADLYAVKVLDGDGGGSFSDVAAGIEWTADQGIDVASLSLGGGDSDAVRDACEYAHAQGTLIVAAAGNEGSRGPWSTVNYPAAYDEVMAISATDEDDNIASFSSVGGEVELAAPGVDILSTLPGDDYGTASGTSMACPHVSGAGAHLMAGGYDNEAARAQLNDTAEDIGLDDNEQGNGLLDVAAALEVDDDDPDPEESLEVETNAASDVGETSATLNGELTELEVYDEATVAFEWGESGSGLANTTAEQTLTSTGSFDEALTGLDADTEYEFRAVAEANGDEDTGDTLSFTTDDEEEDPPDDPSDPVIDEFELSENNNPQWARVNVDWEVSDPDGALDTVVSELSLGGDVLDSSSSSVSGSSASGDHSLRERQGHGETYEVTLTVTDTAGNSTSETQSIDL